MPTTTDRPTTTAPHDLKLCLVQRQGRAGLVVDRHRARRGLHDSAGRLARPAGAWSGPWSWEASTACSTTASLLGGVVPDHALLVDLALIEALCQQAGLGRRRRDVQRVGAALAVAP